MQTDSCVSSIRATSEFALAPTYVLGIDICVLLDQVLDQRLVVARGCKMQQCVEWCVDVSRLDCDIGRFDKLLHLTHSSSAPTKRCQLFDAQARLIYVAMPMRLVSALSA
jgi:hypothetical protein